MSEIEDVSVGTGKRVAIHRFREPAFQEGVQRPVGEKFLRSLAVLDGIIQRRVGEVLAEGSESGVAEGEVVELGVSAQAEAEGVGADILRVGPGLS